MYFLIEGDTVLSFQNPQLGGGNAQQMRTWGLDRDVEKWIARDAESHPIDFKNVELLELK